MNSDSDQTGVNHRFLQGLILAGVLVSLVVGNAPLALALGVVLALLAGNPFLKTTSEWTRRLLRTSVIGLGFGIPLSEVLRVGAGSFWITMFSLLFALGAGWLLTRLLRVDKELGFLLSCGTGICGGSAIAAVAPAIGARQENAAVALAAVFTLNAVAILVFPPLGLALGLSPGEFGAWAALAIHDTSSVVGACAAFGGAAVAVGTTMKLVRALWILPLVAGITLIKRTGTRPSVPWFIAGFVGAAAITGLLPAGADVWALLHVAARHVLAATLFLIGLGLTRETLKMVGARPLAMAVILWAIMIIGAFVAVVNGWATP